MEFLRNAWYVALWSEALKPGELVPRTILGEQLVLFRRADGSVAAVGDRCPHRFAPLHRGQLLPGDRLRCAYHGLEFDSHGACVRNPHGAGKIPPTAAVRAFPVIEKHTAVWVWMGERPADETAIPDFGFLDEGSGYRVSRRDWLRMEANYGLITDNLLDLSHVSFLHDGILGHAGTVAAETKVEQRGNTLFVKRVMPNVVPPGLFDMLFRRDQAPVDMWFTMRWDPPGCMLNDAGVHPPGLSPAQGTGIFGSHLLTPETETTTLYHFAAALQNPQPSRGAADDAEVRQKLSEMRRYAFEEQDAPIIRAQQQNITAAARAGTTLWPILLEIDVGPVHYQRIMRKLAEQERRAETAAGGS